MARRYHVQIWITTFRLHSEGHMEKMQSEGHASFYMAKAEDVNIESSYSLLVYIGTSFVEFSVFILLQNLTYTRSTIAKRKVFSLRECMNHETPLFYFNAKSCNSIYISCPVNFIHTSLTFSFYFCFTIIFCFIFVEITSLRFFTIVSTQSKSYLFQGKLQTKFFSIVS